MATRFGRPGAARRATKRVLVAYVAAEGAGLAHHSYAKRRARNAPLPERAADAEYGRRFLSLARCEVQGGAMSGAMSLAAPGCSAEDAPASAAAADAGREAGAGALACARFVRHAFYGTPPEALPKEAVARWLRGHVGEEGVTEATFAQLEAALGPYAPRGGAAALGSPAAPSFVFGEGHLKSWYKPLPLRAFIEASRLRGKFRLAAEGFKEHRDQTLPALRFWERPATGPRPGPPLVVLHGYGRGIAGPLFSDKMLFKMPLGDRPIIIVDCTWLLVARLPKNGDVTKVPSVRELASAVAAFLESRRGADGAPFEEVDLLGHSFGTAVASALTRELAERKDRQAPGIAVRKAIVMDPMCFMPGITKQAQLIVRAPRDVVEELVQEAAPGSSGLSWREVLSATLLAPPKQDAATVQDSAEAASERRRWVIFQTYFFFYFIFRDLMYSWVNLRSLQGPDYLDRGLLRQMNRRGRLLTVLAETDTMIPASQLRDVLSGEAPADSQGGVLWLPTVGHGACQHRAEVAERISEFLAAA